MEAMIKRIIRSNLSQWPQEIRQCREVTIVERFKQESMYGQSTKKRGCCKVVAIIDSCC